MNKNKVHMMEMFTVFKNLLMYFDNDNIFIFNKSFVIFFIVFWHTYILNIAIFFIDLYLKKQRRKKDINRKII